MKAKGQRGRVQIDIFQLGRTINEKFPEFATLDAPEIDLAIEDLAGVQEKLKRVVAALHKLKPGDYEGFSQILADLWELFQHSSYHIEEAMSSLNKLWKAVSEKTES